ncbi:Uncharacterised protein [Vibrio cholerae]|nr:Uncharacterised protein [Vibrio cholerae]
MGCWQQTKIRSTKLSKYTRLRIFPTAPRGKGICFLTQFIIERKLALTPSPYTNGGRMITTSSPVSAASSNNCCSASYLLKP